MPHDTAKTRLTSQRGEIVAQLAELGATESGDLGGEVDFGEGFADAATATAERTELLGIIDALVKRLAEVDAALVRITDGTYGRCANCGKEIGAARLEHRPESVHCIDCKAANAAV
jgi:RNA polymerase-binding protein DksA